MKIKATNNVKNTSMTTIAIAGAGPGAGATHMAIAFATKLYNAGYRVAVLEDDFKNCYQDMAEELGCPVSNERFTYMGVDYFCYAKPRKLPIINQRSYDYLVVDMGNYENCDKDFFSLSNFRLIVSTARPWKSTSLFDHVMNPAMESGDEEILTTYQYLFLYAANDKKFQKSCFEAMAPIDTLYFLGSIPDPFKNVDFPEINDILGSEVVAEEVNVPKKPSIFGGFGKKKPNSEDVTKDLELQEDKDNAELNPNAGRKMFYMDTDGKIYDEEGAEVEIPELSYGGEPTPPAPAPAPAPQQVYTRRDTSREDREARYAQIRREMEAEEREKERREQERLERERLERERLEAERKAAEEAAKAEPVDTRLFIPESAKISQEMFESVKPNIKLKDDEVYEKVFGDNSQLARELLNRQLQCSVVSLFRAKFDNEPASGGNGVVIKLEKGVWTQYTDKVDDKVREMMEEYL